MINKAYISLILISVFFTIYCSNRSEDSTETNQQTDIGLSDIIFDATSDTANDAVEVVESCKPSAIKNDENYQDKFSLSLFHYNIQYIAGGGEKYENAIIRIGFDPILDILLRHPNWRLSIEMQGYMLEIMEERYPKIFQKLKQLVKNCQIELIVFHYSDQLFLAYPARDMKWSYELNSELFDRVGLFPSGVVFTQEGQFGEGMLNFMKEYGYTIGLYPKNLFRYYMGDVEKKPLYSRYGTDVVIVGAGINSDGIVVDWSFFNDGELLATGGYSPYFVDTGNYKIDEESIKKYEEELLKKESEGYVITTISDYVATIKARGIESVPLPPLLDGTWQPDDTNNFHRWMGDSKGQVDRDNKVLSNNYEARKYVLSLETLIHYLKEKKIDSRDLEQELIKSKRYLAYAEVSDSTGWYPNKVEVDYSLNNASMAKETSINALKAGMTKLGMTRAMKIDNRTREITEVDTPETNDISDSCPKDLPIKEIKTDYYSFEIFCKKVNNARTDVRILFLRKDDTKIKTISLIIPFERDMIEYTPALMDENGVENAILSYNKTDFAKGVLNTSLATGLIKITDDLYFLKHCEYFHISPFIDFDKKELIFTDNSPEAEGFEWRFSFIQGSRETAYNEMVGINTYPIVYVK